MKKHGHYGHGHYGDDILKSMPKIGLTTSEIQSMINIGCSCLTRICNNMKTNNQIVGDTSHNLSLVTLDIFKSFFDVIESNYCILCPHMAPIFHI